MTVEEAKKWLNKLYARADITDEYGDMEDMRPYEEAVDMAIKSLQESDELLDYVTESIEAEKKMMGSCHDLASEDYHKGIIYAFECMKMKLM